MSCAALDTAALTRARTEQTALGCPAHRTCLGCHTAGRARRAHCANFLPIMPIMPSMMDVTDNEASPATCAICLAPMEAAPFGPYRLACTHVMHHHCLMRYVAAKRSDSGLVSCPICRQFTLEYNLENKVSAGPLITLSLPENALFQVRAALVAPDYDGNSGPEHVKLQRMTTELVLASDPWTQSAPRWAGWTGIDEMIRDVSEEDIVRLEIVAAAFAGASMVDAFAPTKGAPWVCPRPEAGWDISMIRSKEATGLLRDLELAMLVLQRSLDLPDETVAVDYRLLIGPLDQLESVLTVPLPT